MPRSAIWKAILAIATLAALAIAFRMLPVGQWLEQFKSWVQELGFLGYILYVVVYAICCVLLVPASALTVGAGAIFGFVAGTIVVLIGATLGATVAFLLARTVFRARVLRFVERHPNVAAVDRALGRQGVKLMLLCRLSGFPPFTWVNYAFGVTGVTLTQYVLTTFFGIIPGALAFSYAGVAGAAVATGKGNRIGLILAATGAVLVSVYVARIALNAIRRAGVEET